MTLIATISYLVVLIVFRFAKFGAGTEFYQAWPLLVGVPLGTQLVWLDLYLCKRFHLREDHLLTQHVLFAAGWIVIALFGITSTSGWIGKGFIMGVGLQLAGRGSLSSPIIPHFFWPIKRTLPESEKKWAVRIFLGAFGLLTLLI